MLAFKNRKREAGDTLIEVLFAVTVFSLVVVTSLSLMNQGTSASVRSLQITLVRQQIDSQAEALRMLNSSYVAAYYPGYAPTTVSPAQQYFLISTDAKASSRTSVSQFGSGDTECQTPPSGSFVVDTRNGTYQKLTASNTAPADTFSQVEYDSSGGLLRARGIWTELVRTQTPSSSGTSATAYTDFHIRACWFATGSGQPMNLGTIVRLYEPSH